VGSQPRVPLRRRATGACRLIPFAPLAAFPGTSRAAHVGLHCGRREAVADEHHTESPESETTRELSALMSGGSGVLAAVYVR
jgi:hypothetical protein